MLLSNKRGLRGTPVEQYWIGAPASYYPPGAAQAKALGYSVPIEAAPLAAGGAIVTYVNPDGTLGQITNWQSWPVSPLNPDPSFVSPPSQAIWQTYMVSLNTAQYANSAGVAITLKNPQGVADGQTTDPCGPGYTGGQPCDVTTPQAVTSSSSASSSSSSSQAAFFSGCYTIAGYCVPYWAFAGAALFFLTRGKR